MEFDIYLHHRYKSIVKVVSKDFVKRFYLRIRKRFYLDFISLLLNASLKFREFLILRKIK
jgi:hypothetical protein